MFMMSRVVRKLILLFLVSVIEGEDFVALKLLIELNATLDILSQIDKHTE